MHEELFVKARELDLSCFDDPEFYNDFVWAMNESDARAAEVLEDTGTLIKRIISSFTLLGLMVHIDWIIAVILFLSSCVTVVCNLLGGRISFYHGREITGLWRVNRYINRIYHLADYAKEIRISHVGDILTKEYDENNKPIRLDAIVVSSQHAPEVSQEQIHEDIKKYVIDAIVDPAMVDADTKIFINPTGRFVIGGPNGDSGLTGRKIIVDTYGGAARHGGGAFSGKDCTKVDRSAAYAARYVAKNIVAAGIADRCEIQLSYAIGVAHPTSICVDTFGTGKLSDEKIVEIIRENFDLRPNGIINMLNLRRPIYKQTASYGHFGRTDLNLPWEQTDKADILKKYL